MVVNVGRQEGNERLSEPRMVGMGRIKEDDRKEKRFIRLMRTWNRVRHKYGA